MLISFSFTVLVIYTIVVFLLGFITSSILGVNQDDDQ